MVSDHWSNDAMVSMDRCGLLETNNHFLFLRLTLQRNTLHWREDVSLSIKVAQADVKHARKNLCAPLTTITLLCDTAL